MKKIPFLTVLFFTAGWLAACNHKPKPLSKDITKTTVAVNGKKDSVINNPQKNYGTATISDPCAKLLLQNIQATNSFKMLTSGKNNITYLMNWVKAEEPRMRSNGGKITNGIEVVVNEKLDKSKRKLGAYIYNNEDGKLYSVTAANQFDELQAVDSVALKRIRNGCYWGVASRN